MLALAPISRHTRPQVAACRGEGDCIVGMAEQNGPTENPSQQAGLPDSAFEYQQRRRMLIALLVLVVALVAVLVKDRLFWFPPSPSIESENSEDNQVRSVQALPVTPVLPAARPNVDAPVHSPVRPKSKRVARAGVLANEQPPVGPTITATNRAVLPPLEVEVVAGDQHRTLKPADRSVKVEMDSAPPAASEDTVAPAEPKSSSEAEHFAARVQMSPQMAQVVSRPVDPTYPLLAKQMKVQGAVVLEALISKSGSIQDIQVLSGPAILSAAAREAVKQWHFKPYYQEGQAVETEARITVNFTISTY